MSDLENLKSALKKWREGVRISNSETSRVSPKNPYGPAIHALNMEWAETRRANDERIRQERERYEAKRKELAEASEGWKREYGGRQDGRGRPKNPEYSDEVKIAAARLFRSSGSKTIVRSALVFRDTAHLNSVLEEGKALLQAQESQEEPW